MDCDLKRLEPEFKDKVLALLSECLKLGYEMVPFFGVRDPWGQARLWRQSRTELQVNSAIEAMRGGGASFLSEVLSSVGPQWGKWATNALPGLSWHQWGEALDCFVVGSGGQAIWDAKHDGYSAYARVAYLSGLEAGHFWEKRDSVHVQKRRDRVLSLFSWAEIDAVMQLRFNNGGGSGL
jgi:hypothetical protein